MLLYMAKNGKLDLPGALNAMPSPGFTVEIMPGWQSWFDSRNKLINPVAALKPPTSVV